MKLIFLIDSNRKIGGGSYAQYVFAKHLAKLGHQVTIFAGDKNFYSSNIDHNNLEVYYRSTIPKITKGIGLGKLNRWWSWFYEWRVIRPYVRNHQPDWIIGYLHQSAIDAVSLGSRFRVKVANFVYETPEWMEAQLGIQWNEKEKRYFNEHKTAYENSTILIPNSKLAASYMRRWIPEVTVTQPVYPGINPIDVTSTTRDYDIIYVGRLHKLKNVDQLLKACKPEHKIAIIGNGEEMSSLKEIATQAMLNVDFLGSVSDQAKWEYLSRSKLLVCPTRFEGFGMPPLEALTCGCKVLCSNIPILKEVYGSDVEYFELDDIEDLSTRIEQLLSTNHVKKSNLPQVYTWENAANTIEKILLEHNLNPG